jgi:hypothetical protein
MIHIPELGCFDPLALTCEVYDADYSLTCSGTSTISTYTLKGQDY